MPTKLLGSNFNKPSTLRFHDHRPVPVAFPLGPFSTAQGRYQAAHPTGFTGQHPQLDSRHPWQNARGRFALTTSPSNPASFTFRSGVSGLWPPLPSASVSGLFCHPLQKQISVPKDLFPTRRKIERGPSRSNHRTPRLLCPERLSRTAPKNSLLRPREKETAHFLNQQFYAAFVFDYRTVSLPLEDRTVFQMDQTASPPQGILWNFGECGKDPNLDCHYGLCAGGHRQKGIEIGPKPLHNFTDFECEPFSKNPIISTT